MSLTLTILPQDRSIQVRKGTILIDALHNADVNLIAYCNKIGLCGKCFVEIVKGTPPPPDPREKEFMARKRLGKTFRLACLHRMAGDLTVCIPEESQLLLMPVLKRGLRRTLLPDPSVKKVLFALSRPDLASPLSLSEQVQAHFPGLRHKPSPRILEDMAGFMDDPSGEATAALYEDAEILDLEPGDTAEQNFGIAIDLGTTTLVAELVNLNTGKTLDSATALNAQIPFGADVLSRITAVFQDPKKSGALRAAVLVALNTMIEGMLKKRRIATRHVYEIVVAGNTAMNHLFLGAPVKTLAVSPYHAVFSSLPPLSASEAGLLMNPHGKVFIAPNIKSFVGGDIAAGLVAVDLVHQPGNYLFIDLGTNGEIVLKKGRQLTATSTAAGPAFEGMNISCGMLAVPGAVYKAEFRRGLRVMTIGSAAAHGVCGTGLIDLIAIFLDQGLLSPQGHIQKREKEIRAGQNIVLLQKDIREVQLAAAAIKTGIRLLLGLHKLTVADLDGIYVAGAFGNYLNIDNSMRLGLLPRLDKKKILFVGNSSLAGAKALLVSRQERARCERLVQTIKHVSLATDATFQKTFIEALEFRAWT
jgi:uncharacterized 2Fe-2S/4Fe-4S cluster protein (DUF4445 family)